ncbi:ferrous iron transport protein A [Alkalithermobacter thermoalcaliphilus JW-YL-7 = DSM 7308]|uniref:FeoA family protein n=1 Tax=Alkalithermobacter thermoalcaliphilus JW-YL-7 = DSM 7308 TaxID=1121328 RepID=A0A150FML7_CLOPD|nr:FeoA family protein [[Clostridium] paradoxum JW-YL-7 = DSM 7308]SHL21279.1 ferrous iron transport protein A [[Clostridium] paradoxum JW-YL-7 = DSM 7308]
MKKIIYLSQLPIGESGEVLNLLLSGSSRRRMLDLGIVKGATIKAVRKSPLGDPTAYYIKGALIALRKEEADQILIKIDSK